MGRPARCVVAVLALMALGAATAACGNSSDDDSGSSAANSGGSGGSGGSGTVDEADRDVHESISGVPGVSDDAITFDVIGLGTGNPLGTCILDCYQQGIKAYFDYRNSQGGIYGRDLKIGDVLDDELSQNQAKALEVVSANDAFGVFDAPLLASGFADLDDAGIPTYSWGIHPEAANHQAIFPSLAPLCFDCTSRVVPWAVKHLGAHKVASLGYGTTQNSKLCAQADGQSIDMYGDHIDAESVYVNDSLDYGLPNGVGPEVSAMKDAGVDFIATCLDLNGVKTLAQELDRQGMGDVPVYHPNTYNQQFVADADPLFEGDVVTVSFLAFEADRTEALDAFLHWMDQDGNDPSELAMVGWINADEAFTSLLAAGPRFDRESAIAGMNSLTEYSAGGLINPIDWTKQHTPPTEDDRSTDYRQECAVLVQVVHAEFETVAPADKPWLCWSNDNLDWSDPTPTSFADN
jgi:Periplasmic binding protein